jgi:hypothetical protein
MASSSARAISPVNWVIQPVAVGRLTLTVARLQGHLYLAMASTGPPSVLQPAWLGTGAPLSVIPYHVHQQGLRWQPIPGVQATRSG